MVVRKKEMCVCCGVLRCVAVRCGAVRCSAVRCGALRCTAGYGVATISRLLKKK